MNADGLDIVVRLQLGLHDIDGKCDGMLNNATFEMRFDLFF